MTKKHFRRLAAVFAMMRPSVDETEARKQWETDFEAVADVCAEINPAFDHARFREACNA